MLGGLIIGICVLAGILTVIIGINPVEQYYASQTKRRLFRLTWIYGVATLLFLAIFFAFRL